MKTRAERYSGDYTLYIRSANGPRLRVPKNLRGNPNNMFLAKMIADSHKAQNRNFEKLAAYIEDVVRYESRKRG